MIISLSTSELKNIREKLAEIDKICQAGLVQVDESRLSSNSVRFKNMHDPYNPDRIYYMICKDTEFVIYYKKYKNQPAVYEVCTITHLPYAKTNYIREAYHDLSNAVVEFQNRILNYLQSQLSRIF